MLHIHGFKNIGEIANGIAITDDGEYYSATALASLQMNGLPNSRAGIYKKAEREKWAQINIPGKGAKDGVAYFKVPEDLLMTNENMVFDVHSNKASSNISLNQKSNKYGEEGHIYIDKYPEIRGAAGIGQLTPTDQVIVKLAVNAADWRNYVGLDHRHIKVISVHGDSMKPALTHGDQVLVDTACSHFLDDAIYAIQQGDLTRFKRVKLRLDGAIEVKSDNEKEGFKSESYTAEEAADFKIIGRVIPFKFGRFDI